MKDILDFQHKKLLREDIDTDPNEKMAVECLLSVLENRRRIELDIELDITPNIQVMREIVENLLKDLTVSM